jgi:hypothetical protein
MPGGTIADMSRTRFAVNFCGRRFEHRADVFVNLELSADHYARAMSRPFFAATYADAQELDPFFGEKNFPAFCVCEVRVSAIDYQIALSEKRNEIADHRIYDRARRNQKHDLTRQVERCDERGQVFGGSHGELAAFFEQQDPLCRVQIKTYTRESVLCDVKKKIAAHRPKSDHPEMRVAHNKYILRFAANQS